MEVVPCGIIEAIQTGCELSNNITIITELLVGGGLAALFFIIQRKSSKKQSDLWKEKRVNAHDKISVHAALLELQLDDDNDLKNNARMNSLVDIAKEKSEFLDDNVLRTIEDVQKGCMNDIPSKTELKKLCIKLRLLGSWLQLKK